MYPHLCFELFFKKLPKNSKVAFVTTFVVGMLGNLFAFANKFVNHDDILAEFSYNNEFDISCGRFMWLYLRRLATYYDLPMIKGLLTILLLSISVAIFVNVIDLKESFYVILVSFIFATYPINACFFSYLAIAEIYFFAIFFVMLALKFATFKKWIGILLSGIFLCMALGTYQSILCLFIATAFILAFRDLISENFSLKDWFFHYLRYVLSAVIGYILYYITTLAFLKIYNVSLRNYAGTDKMFSFNFTNLLKSLNTTYSSFFNYFFTENIIQYKMYMIANIILALIIITAVLVNIFKFIKNKKYINAIILILMCITIPVFLDFVHIMMNDKSAAHILMQYSNILFYAFAIMLSTKTNLNVNICNAVISWACTISLIAMCYYGILISNQLYQKMYYNAKAMDSVATTLIASLHNIEGWTVDEPVLFGNFDSFFNNNYRSATPMDTELPMYIWMGTDLYPWYGPGHLTQYMGFNQHITLTAYEGSDTDDILESREYHDMSTFPNAGSIKRIDGIVVVKFN